MPTFIATLKFTAQGVQNLQQSPQRAEKFTLAAQAQGIKAIGLTDALAFSQQGNIVLDLLRTLECAFSPQNHVIERMTILLCRRFGTNLGYAEHTSDRSGKC